MKVVNFFVAVGIAFLFASFMSNMASTFYKAPKANYTGCYDNAFSFGSSSSAISDCYDQAAALCDPDDFDCLYNIYDSDSYKDCVDAADSSGPSSSNSGNDCEKREQKKQEAYQMVLYLILGIISLTSIVLGFFLMSNESVGAGIIGGGVILLLFGAVFAAILGAISTITGAFSSIMAGGAEEAATGTSPVAYLNLFFSFIGLAALIAFSYIKLGEEKEESVKLV